MIINNNIKQFPEIDLVYRKYRIVIYFVLFYPTQHNPQYFNENINQFLQILNFKKLQTHHCTESI